VQRSPWSFDVKALPAARLTLCVLAVLTGCDQTLQPDAPFEKRLVVYAIFSNRSDMQLARIFTTYPAGAAPSTVDSASFGVADASLEVSDGKVTYAFADTLVRGQGLQGEPTWISAWVSHGFRVEEHRTYELAVHSPSLGTARSSAISLSPGGLSIAHAESLFLPASIGEIPVSATFPANTAAFIIRFTVQYLALLGGVWQPASVEIPLDIVGLPDSVRYVYPAILPRGQKSDLSTGSREMVVFSGRAYRAILQSLYEQYSRSGVRFKKAVFTLTQIDYPLYAYYRTVNQVPGVGTLRLDEPDYSNIQGGLGVFSTMRDDADTLLLSETLPF
jgi:hypothetical protein